MAKCRQFMQTAIDNGLRGAFLKIWLNIIAIICAAWAFSLPHAALATQYSYATNFAAIDGEEILTIDSVSGQATLVGSGTAVTLVSKDFKNFRGGDDLGVAAFVVTEAKGAIQSNGRVFAIEPDVTNLMRFEGGQTILLWAKWKADNGRMIQDLRGTYADYIAPTGQNVQQLRQGVDNRNNGARAIAAPAMMGGFFMFMMSLIGWRSWKRRRA